MFEWSVDPEIISIGFLSIRWYSLMFMLSFMIGIFIFRWIYRLENKPESDIDQILIYMLLGTVLGARIGHCLFYDPIYYLSNPVKILMVWEGGLASHGAAIGILFVLYLYSKKHPDQPYMWVVDRIVITVALSGFFIRMGNFFNSEIIGRATDLPWAVILTRVDNVPRHPTQLYEAFAYLAIFYILLQIYRKNGAELKRGTLLGMFLILVFSFRFFVEFLKENQVSFEAGMDLNMGQILSIPSVLAGIYIYAKRRTPDLEKEARELKKRKRQEK